MQRRAELEAFRAWLLGPVNQDAAIKSSARTFRRNTAWCWRVEPQITITGQIYDQVQIDGIYLSSKWCCLIAINDGKVIAWQWCDREKTASWAALLEQIPPPVVVISDGGSGLLAAVKQTWPTTKIQRCLVHVQRNIRTQLTANPRTDAGKSLWTLAKQITRIKDSDQAIGWLQQLNDWHGVYGKLTRERTYWQQLKPGQTAPAGVKQGQRWWFTHQRLRRAYRQLAKLAQNEHLFVYLQPEIKPLKIASTTNQIEGGINAGLRDLLRRHRGMPAEHQRRAIEWWLTDHAIAAPTPASLIRPEHHRPPPKKGL